MADTPTPSDALSALLCGSCIHSTRCAYECDYGGKCWKKKAVMYILKECD